MADVLVHFSGVLFWCLYSNIFARLYILIAMVLRAHPSLLFGAVMISGEEVFLPPRNNASISITLSDGDTKVPPISFARGVSYTTVVRLVPIIAN